MKKLYSVGKVKTTIIARNTGEICKQLQPKKKREASETREIVKAERVDGEFLRKQKL